MNRAWAFVAGVASAALAVAVLIWSGSIVVGHDREVRPRRSERPITATVRRGSAETVLGRIGTWAYPSAGTITSGADGTITRIDHASGTPLDEDDVIVHVDEVPFTVAEGAIPMYRTLEVGVEGDDVAQLQAFLERRDLWPYRHDGRFTADVAQAVMFWQRRQQAPETGTVSPATLAFVPKLPVVATLPAALTVGSTHAAGEPVAEIASATPEVSVALDEDEATTLDLPAPVRVTGGGTSVDGTLESVAVDAEAGDGSLKGKVVLDADRCRTACTPLFQSSGGQVQVTIVVQPRVAGLVVPPAAVQLDGEGRAFVTMADGRRRIVRVRGRSSNATVLDGVAEGDVVRIPT